MSEQPFDPDASERSTDRSVDDNPQHRRAAWLEANRIGIEDYNPRVARDGLFGDEWQTF